VFAQLLDLDVAENLVETLPASLLQLRNLRVLWCDENPISSPPLEVVQGENGKSDLKKLMGYFKAAVSSGTIENLSLKVMVLGRSEVGKTSLVNAMVERVSRLTRVGDRTVGIEQRNWTVLLQNGKRLVLKVLDFAGQDEYCKYSLFCLCWHS
jgi:ribosome biogenesis GTPase A